MGLASVCIGVAARGFLVVLSRAVRNVEIGGFNYMASSLLSSVVVWGAKISLSGFQLFGLRGILFCSLLLLGLGLVF